MSLNYFLYALAIEVLLLFCDYFSSNNYLGGFIRSHSVDIMGLLLGLNLTNATFLLNGLKQTEIMMGEVIFTETKNEIKHNVIFMFVLFLSNLGLLSLTPISPQGEMPFLFKFCGLYVFLIFMMLVLEIIMCIFKISHSSDEIALLARDNTKRKTRRKQ